VVVSGWRGIGSRSVCGSTRRESSLRSVPDRSPPFASLSWEPWLLAACPERADVA
jgi:hypothetical protein